VMSLGQLSRWYNSLLPMPTRRVIARAFEFDEKVLERLLHHLTTVRNVCAHHGRLWNREFTVIPQLPRSKPFGLNAQLVPGSRRLYNTLVLLVQALSVVSPGNHWRDRLLDLCSKHRADYTVMGFPAGWESMPIWA
ncbi:MAG TPA: Abi family protein, partial [Thermoanaerobaculia bacterium]|nr:Abi family protein [Thermoanaerobaculia bacterium]